MINDDESHCIFGGMYAFTESVSSDGWPLRRDRHLKLLCFVVRGMMAIVCLVKAPKALYRGDAGCRVVWFTC